MTDNNSQCLFYSDINECAADPNPCSKENEECINSEGSFTCDCKDGFRRKGDACVKGKKKKKTTKKKDELTEEDIKKGNYISENHLKIGSLLYAVFFGLVFLGIRRENYKAVGFLVITYVLVLAYMYTAPTDDGELWGC